MQTLKILSPEAHTDHKDIIFPTPNFEHEWKKLYGTKQEDLVKVAQGYDILVINKLKITEEVLQNLPQLKLIAMLATGYNNIDVEACRRHGVALCNIRGYGTESVAEHAFSLMLALARNIGRYSNKVADLTWSKQNNFRLMDYPVIDLFNKKLLIIGYGAIGKRIAQIAKNGFGMEVLIAERKEASSIRDNRIAFNEGLKQADFIIVSCPAVNETINLISEEEFKLMKTSALLINIARGGIVDETALANALKNDQIMGAAIDTVAIEPINENNPLLSLLKTHNLIITPHIAWLGDIAIANIGKELVANINAFVEGEERNRVV